jgi:hypothetical protein
VTDRLHVPKVACPSCPYRKDTPPGVWDPSEYAKLERYDEPDFRDPDCKVDPMTYIPEISVFHCHQEKATGKPTVCRGWVSVHRHSVGVRVGIATGALEPSDVPEDAEPLYYETGAQAAAAGLSGCDEPSPEAEVVQAKLLRSRAGRRL